MFRKYFRRISWNSLFWKLLLAVSALITISLVIQIMAAMYFGALHDQKSFDSLVQREIKVRSDNYCFYLTQNDSPALKQNVIDEIEIFPDYIIEIFDYNEQIVIRYPNIQNDLFSMTVADIREFGEWVKSPWKQFLSQLHREFTREEQKMQKVYVAGELICPENGNLVGYFSVRENFPTMSVLILDIAWQGLVFSLIVTLFLAIPIFLIFWRRIKKLIGSIRKYREGNLETRILVKSEDEIGLVGLAFNKMASQIEENIDIIKQHDNQRREFIANVSHDLKTPLTSIIGYVETLSMKGNIKPEEARYLETISTNAFFMDNMITDLQTLSNLESGQIEMNFSMHQFDDLVSDIVMGFTPLIEKKQIHLTFEAPDETVLVELDYHQIERVVQNLYKNAIKFTPQNGKIQIEITNLDEFVRLTIQDSGIGISAENLDKVFNRFFRTKESKQNFEGTGLGLAIAREIVQNHGGTISAESEIGKGAKFCFDLPK